MGYRVNFAPHLGFPGPGTPLFAELAGGTDLGANIAFAAQQGFRTVQDPGAAQRPVQEQARLGELVAEAGLSSGSFVYGPPQRVLQRAWCATDAAGRAELDVDFAEAIAIARRIGSRHIIVVTAADPERPRDEQGRAMTENLARLAGRAADEGVALCVEAVSALRVPHFLLHHFADAIEVVRNVDHPAVRLVYDTAHVQAMDGDLPGNLDRAWDLIEVIQLADHPARTEPGTGTPEIIAITDELARRGFDKPVELEHIWSASGGAVQRDYLAWLDRWKC